MEGQQAYCPSIGILGKTDNRQRSRCNRLVAPTSLLWYLAIPLIVARGGDIPRVLNFLELP